MDTSFSNIYIFCKTKQKAAGYEKQLIKKYFQGIHQEISRERATFKKDNNILLLEFIFRKAVYLYLYLHLFIHLSIYLSICLSIYICNIYIYIYIYIYILSLFISLFFLLLSLLILLFYYYNYILFLLQSSLLLVLSIINVIYFIFSHFISSCSYYYDFCLRVTCMCPPFFCFSFPFSC